MIDEQARKEILAAINTPYESKRTQDIKPKYQKELHSVIYNAFKSGKVTSDEVSAVYSILANGNYSAWVKEFKELHEKFQRDQNISALLMSLTKLFHEFKIEARIMAEVKKLAPEDLVLVGCMFLVNPSFKEWNLLAA